MIGRTAELAKLTPSKLCEKPGGTLVELDVAHSKWWIPILGTVGYICSHSFENKPTVEISFASIPLEATNLSNLAKLHSTNGHHL